MDWTKQLRDIGQDLVTLEVNTIESSGISGRKMPSYPHALLDIAQKYADFLTGPAVGLELDPLASAFRSEGRSDTDVYFKVESPRKFLQREALREKGGESLDEAISAFMNDQRLQFIPGGTSYTVKLTNGWETFEFLRWAANKTLDPAESHEGAPEIGRKARGILWRIARNCDQLKLVADGLRRDENSKPFIGKTRRELVALKEMPKPAPPQYLTRIRKAWDLGTDTIVLQTVVQLDGDITFRASPQLLRDGKSPFLEAHERATSVGLGHWQQLFQLVFGLLTDKIGRIFEPGG